MHKRIHTLEALVNKQKSIFVSLIFGQSVLSEGQSSCPFLQEVGVQKKKKTERKKSEINHRGKIRKFKKKV